MTNSDITAGLVVHPGDTLIVTVPTSTTAEHAYKVRELLLERLPMLADVVVVAAESVAAIRESQK